MLSRTLQEGLKGYSIGEKLRSLRLRKGLGLVELGRHTGLSPALLSKLERGKLFPTLPTLLRISLVFSVGLEHFFTPERRRRVVAIVRKGERRRFPDRMGAKEPAYEFESLDFPATERRLNAYLAEFHPVAPDKVKPHTHAGVEFLYVFRGQLGLRIGAEEHLLDAGDAIYFDSGQPHGYRREGAKPCSAIVVSIPAAAS
jgi:transcriptional regulator with XRE-family HTH domain